MAVEVRRFENVRLKTTQNDPCRLKTTQTVMAKFCTQARITLRQQLYCNLDYVLLHDDSEYKFCACMQLATFNNNVLGLWES